MKMQILMKKENEIKVFISSRESICAECKEELGRHAWITLHADKGALCLSCADLDHLDYLPAGDTALTRRSKKYSKLYAVVLQWSKRRKRYERQGLLVEPKAIDQAEGECASDGKERELARKKAALRRNELDEKFIKKFSDIIRTLYP